MVKETRFIVTIAVTPCISSLSMCGSEKNRGITRRFEQCTLSVFRRLQDSNWEWSLYGVERDPDVGISSVLHCVTAIVNINLVLSP